MFKISNNNFKILGKYKDFMNKIDSILENVPRRDIYYKDRLRNVLDIMLSFIFKSSYENDKNKLSKYYVEIKADIALIDFMLDRLHSKKYINEKTLYKVGNDLIEINKMITGWLNGKL